MGCSTSLIFVKHAGYVTSVEYLVRRPLGAEALEASYFTRPQHVEEARAWHGNGQMVRASTPQLLVHEALSD
jgi:hypothetical protein